MNYTDADEKLHSKLSRKVAGNTYLVRNSGVPGDSIHLKFHNTYVITWYADGRTELNSGGYLTVTTKARINEYLEEYSITQQDFVWYLYRGSQRIGIFADGVTICADGVTITGLETQIK